MGAGVARSAARMRKALISLLAIQAAVTLAVAAGFYVYQGLAGAAAAGYGGLIALAVSGLLAWRLSRASRPGAGVAGLFLGALERFVFVAAAFAVGIALLKLAPIALIAGFVGAELGYYVAAGVMKDRLGKTDGG